MMKIFSGKKMQKKLVRRSGFIQDFKKSILTPSYGPRYVTIDITNRCNLNCIACWTYSPLLEKKPEKRWFRKELDIKVIKRLVDDLADLGTTEIRLTGGGEPFLHPDILEICEYIKSKGMKLDITTNFTLVSKDNVDKLCNIGVDVITISLWAVDENTYADTHPNQKGTRFRKIIEKIKYLKHKKTRPRMTIANVISNINYSHVEDMVNLAKEVSDEVYFTFIDPMPGTETLLLKKKQQFLLRKKLERIDRGNKEGKYGSLVIDNLDNMLRRVRTDGMRQGRYEEDFLLDMPCTIGYTFSRVMADGGVAPCCKAVMIPTGNINEQSFKDIWNSQKQQEFRSFGRNLKEDLKLVNMIGCTRSCDNISDNIHNLDLINGFDNDQ